MQIQEEMEQLRIEILQQEQDHGSLLRDIDEQQKETESQAEDYENQANIINKILDEIKTGLVAFYFMGLWLCVYGPSDYIWCTELYHAAISLDIHHVQENTGSSW